MIYSFFAVIMFLMKRNLSKISATTFPKESNPKIRLLLRTLIYQRTKEPLQEQFTNEYIYRVEYKVNSKL